MNRIILILSILTVLLITGCQSNSDITFTSEVTEEFRPTYHFTPESGWMNDPNGLIYLDGEYHLFYQHYPDSTVWGPMHWGHAVSSDLVNWEHLPIALFPDSLGYIFSGSAVLDTENTSGLGTAETPPIVAIFTYHNAEEANTKSQTFQSQAIAFSLDKGRTWQKYEGNPVLPNPGIRDFRDPKVSQITNENGTKSWIMTLAVLDQINFYSSPDLKSWTLLSEFGKTIGAHGGVWECPDLLPFKTPSGEGKWVLLVSINPGGPQNGSATQYFIGDFKNGQFTPDDTMIRWLDYGPDNYAGVTWSNLPSDHDRTLFIGWMSNWLYANEVPTKAWRSAMTLPRELSLFDVDGTLLLKSAPAKELEKLRDKEYKVTKKSSSLPSEAVELISEVNSDSFMVTFSNELNEKLVISKELGLVNIDRRNAGKSTFQRDFAAIHSAPMSWEATEIRIFLDASSVELFVNDGELVMTSILFPSSPWKTVEVSDQVNSLKIYNLKK
ncbi:fructan beta-fructosidase [Algoriphagus ratkowskyi]|uniref:Fructan beta-fructosidase n=1 Tax=Algoriphagus ratkowskyi TaxID=57028 RepID=A0A2W7QZE4_9BACT|nr:glycoside hydrolase family 32 protein [Algoriphagus ratkowskyi]PZX53923.1 fructan beta-fructosidase [Algoriphagus ratkowskyi]TXD76677.1 glycoside hydrolase family 32 protein [Algoriphagus ratkowskyi]